MPIPTSHTVPAEMRPQRGRILGALLLLGAIAVFCCSLFVIVPAPTAWLWIVSILVGEWGHYAAVVCMLLVAVSLWRGGTLGISSAGVYVVAACLCLLPLARARLIAHDLPALCTRAFGEVPEGAAQRRRALPLNLWDAFAGIQIPAVEVSEHVYARTDSKELKLDLYQTRERSTPQPLVVVIHGGSWSGGNKRQLTAMNRYLASEGYAVASINYRHAPKWPFPAARDDVFRAIEFLKWNAAKFGIDATRIVLLGRSAGGQLALSAAYNQRDPAIRGVIAFYAPSDLALGYEKPSPPRVMDSRRVLRDYLGGSPAQISSVYAAASPLNDVRSTTPPTLLIHGALDPIVQPMHSRLLSQRLTFFNRPSLYLELPWATHGCDANLSGPSGQLSLYAVDRFLAAVFAQ